MAGPALLFDVADGRVLYSEDADNQWHPASLTKIMTAYVTFEALKEGKLTMASKIGCSELASSQAPSKIGLPVGAEMTVETALQALIVKSANDVAMMLAEAVSGSQEAFAARMNATAARLGMTRTKYVNPNGLPAPEQVTTARDLGKLSAAALRDYPEHAALWSMLEVKMGKRRLHTHNGLLTNYAGADGMKTGFICDSGFNVVASATREGHKLIAVVLGEATGGERSTRAANLLEHGFRTIKWKGCSRPRQRHHAHPETPGPPTMRQSVVSYECGTGAAAVARAKKGTDSNTGGAQPKPAKRPNRQRARDNHSAPIGPRHQLSCARDRAAASGRRKLLAGRRRSSGACCSARARRAGSGRRVRLGATSAACAGRALGRGLAIRAASASRARTPTTGVLEAIAVLSRPPKPRCQQSTAPAHRGLPSIPLFAQLLYIRRPPLTVVVGRVRRPVSTASAVPSMSPGTQMASGWQFKWTQRPHRERSTPWSPCWRAGMAPGLPMWPSSFPRCTA
jgi:D-alanyl-D-alanine carboxypeptidase